MRIIQKQAWAVDAHWIPNTLDYLETLSYTTDPECDAEVMVILSKETVNKNPFDECLNVQMGTCENRINKFEDVLEELCVLPEALNVRPDVPVEEESGIQVTHEKPFKDVWEEINALAEILYVEPVVSRDEESASQERHGQISLELLTAANENCGKKKKRKQSVPRRLLGRIKKIFGIKKIK